MGGPVTPVALPGGGDLSGCVRRRAQEAEDDCEGDSVLVRARRRLTVVAAMVGALSSSALLLGWGVRVTLIEARISEAEAATMREVVRPRSSDLASTWRLITPSHGGAVAIASRDDGLRRGPTWDEVLAVATTLPLSEGSVHEADAMASRADGLRLLGLGSPTSASPVDGDVIAVDAGRSPLAAAADRALSDILDVRRQHDPLVRRALDEVARLETLHAAQAAAAAAEQGERTQAREAIFLSTAARVRATLDSAGSASTPRSESSAGPAPGHSTPNDPASRIARDFSRELARAQREIGTERVAAIDAEGVHAVARQAAVEARLEEELAVARALADAAIEARHERLLVAETTYERAVLAARESAGHRGGEGDNGTLDAMVPATPNRREGRTRGGHDAAPDFARAMADHLGRLDAVRSVRLLRPDLAALPVRIVADAEGAAPADAAAWATVRAIDVALRPGAGGDEGLRPIVNERTAAVNDATSSW